MRKNRYENTAIKRKYLLWLGDAKGLSPKTITKAAASISEYESFLDGLSFRSFHSERARAFKRFLAKPKGTGKDNARSSATIDAILKNVKDFFHWLADQPGYKSRINHSEVDYFSTARKTDRTRRGGCWKPHPSPEQYRRAVLAMPADTVIHRRDRALMALFGLTASREGAAISLRLHHVDPDNFCVHFNGREVDTKFGKSFTSWFYPIGDDIAQILIEWVDELRTVHLFSASDPLFPKTRVGRGNGTRFAALGITREPWASASSAVKIFKSAFRAIGLPEFSPHLIRYTIVDLASRYCKTPEDFKSWSQNMGHDGVHTTFSSYGNVEPGRQGEIIRAFGKRNRSGKD